MLVMIRARVSSRHCVDQSNGDLYRALHVDKNIIQREILNPEVRSFVFPIPPPAPVPVRDNRMDDDY